MVDECQRAPPAVGTASTVQAISDRLQGGASSAFGRDALAHGSGQRPPRTFTDQAALKRGERVCGAC
jgi:hypothetical protein